MKPVFFLASAKRDLRAEKKYYKKISPELATRFENAVEKQVSAVSEYPQAMQVLEFEIRRWPVGSGFPHGILYRNNETEIVVLAIFHPKRNPNIWRKRGRI